MKIILLLLFPFYSLAFNPESAEREGLLYFQKFDVQDQDNIVIVSEDKGQLLLGLFDQEKKKLFSFTMAATEFFHRAEVTSINKYEGNILITLWNKGVHGKQLFIHDLKSGKELLHVTSSFTLDYRISADNISIDWTGDMQKNQTPKKEKTIWPK